MSDQPMLKSNKIDQEDLFIEKPTVNPSTGSSHEQPEGRDLRKTAWRWLILFMACNFLIGSYYCYDIPGVLKNQIEQDFSIKPTQYSLLYTVYSIPNMILPLIGGIILDKIGIRVGLFAFTVVLTLGQFIFYLGGNSMQYSLMLVGRVVFGLGGESMSVAQSSIIS
jgi:MFS family permease